MYYEVVAQDGHTRRTQLVYGDTPEGAIRTARAYGLVGRIVEVRELMLVSVWIPPETMGAVADVLTKEHIDDLLQEIWDAGGAPR